MPRDRSTLPTYQQHSSGRARVRVYDAAGKRIDIILPGDYGSEESKREYERILAQLRANGGSLTAEKAVTDLTVVELIERFLDHAGTYYVDPVTKEPTSEIGALTAAYRPLLRLYGSTPSAEFGPMALQNLRNAMLTASWMSEAEQQQWNLKGRKLGLARTTCNDQISRIKLLFRWGASQELIPVSVAHGLATVAGLRRGRSAARETEPVKPVSLAIIDDTLPQLPPVVKDMVQVLLYTGMRCGELCIMRACDLDLSGEVWLYRPERHKGLWRGRERVIAIGPRGQEIVRKYLKTNLQAYLFSPADQEEIIRGQRRTNRKTPLYPSHMKRLAAKRKPDGERRPGERFTTQSVNHSIRRACERADIDPWHVHQLRHSASLAFSRELGLEAARAALGHASVDMSAMYAGHDLEAAKQVASKIG